MDISPIRGLRMSLREICWGLLLLCILIGIASDDSPNQGVVSEVGVSYFPLQRITDQPTSSFVYACTVFYLMLIAYLGERFVVRRLVSDREHSYAVRYYAGFVPGYILAAAFNRIITFTMPNTVAPRVIAFCMIAATLYSVFRSIRCREEESPQARQSMAKTMLGWVSTTVALLLFTIYYLERAVDHITGDAFTFFNKVVASAEYGIGSTGSLALIAQHYDELTVAYPIWYGIIGQYGGEPLTTIWLLNGFFLTGATCLLWINGRFLELSHFENSALLLVILFGSFSLNLRAQFYLLFDSGNPLSQVLHPGRVFGILLPILFVGMFQGRALSALASRREQFLLFAAFSCGIAATTISNALIYITLIGFWVGMRTISAAIPPTSRRASLWEHSLAAGILLFPLSAFFTFQTRDRYGHYLLLTLIGAIVLYVVKVLLSIERTTIYQIARKMKDEYAAPIGGSVCGFLVGFLFLGNVGVGLIAKLVGNKQELWGKSVLYRPLAMGPLVSLKEMVGAYAYPGRFPLEHTMGPVEFLARYGIIFIMSAVGLYWIRKMRTSYHDEHANIDRAWYYGRILIVYYMFFLIWLFYFDFMAAHISWYDWIVVWVRSRMIEPWFYAVVYAFYLFMAALLRSSAGKIAYFASASYLVHGRLIYPAVALSQWLVNARFFVKHIM